MDDAPTSPIPDPVTNPKPEAPAAPGTSTPAPGASTPAPGTVTPEANPQHEPSPPQSWASTVPEAAAPAPVPAPSGRTVARSTFLIGLVVAAALGVAGAGILFTLRDQVTDAASVGAPYGIHEDQQDGRFGQGGSRGDADQDHGTWDGTGRHGQQGRMDGRMPPGGGRHGGIAVPDQDGGSSTPAPEATSTPSPDATNSPEATESPS